MGTVIANYLCINVTWADFCASAYGERTVTLKCAKDSFSRKGVLFEKRTTLKRTKDFYIQKIPHLVKKDICFSEKEFVMLSRLKKDSV